MLLAQQGRSCQFDLHKCYSREATRPCTNISLLPSSGTTPNMPPTSFVESQDIAQLRLFERTPNNATNRTSRDLLRPSVNIKSLRRVIFLLEKELHVLSCYRIAPGQRIFCGVSVDEYTRGAARIVVKSDALVRGNLFRVTPTDRD